MYVHLNADTYMSNFNFVFSVSGYMPTLPNVTITETALLVCIQGHLSHVEAYMLLLWGAMGVVEETRLSKCFAKPSPTWHV
ncbi:hypothetical protein GDO78_023249 [Eleutherodactylus coqui]|uniref:Uncharacterized protein n=1 Tax=Eleutherodactylus coqui TaxID=57060 RepID=A0A8J6BFP8_ELECQ|nr:hypothetical protein GDO78_023249 [Eleutherodactylus coqui]